MPDINKSFMSNSCHSQNIIGRMLPPAGCWNGCRGIGDDHVHVGQSQIQLMSIQQSNGCNECVTECVLGLLISVIYQLWFWLGLKFPLPLSNLANSLECPAGHWPGQAWPISRCSHSRMRCPISRNSELFSNTCQFLCAIEWPKSPGDAIKEGNYCSDFSGERPDDQRMDWRTDGLSTINLPIALALALGLAKFQRFDAIFYLNSFTVTFTAW